MQRTHQYALVMRNKIFLLFIAASLGLVIIVERSASYVWHYFYDVKPRPFIQAWEWHRVMLVCSFAPPVARIELMSVKLAQDGLAERLI